MSEKARVFATAAHAAAGQVRKWTGDPYIVHPEEVVKILTTHVAQCSDNMRAAGYLHDVVEDTKVTLDLIIAEFGTAVADIVDGLTSKESPEDGNRQVRKHKEMIRLSKCSWQVKTIKLADLISNTHTIAEHDKHFASTYMAEKRMMLDHALKDGDEVLWAIADDIVRKYYKELVK